MISLVFFRPPLYNQAMKSSSSGKKLAITAVVSIYKIKFISIIKSFSKYFHLFSHAPFDHDEQLISLVQLTVDLHGKATLT